MILKALITLIFAGAASSVPAVQPRLRHGEHDEARPESVNRERQLRRARPLTAS